MPPPSVLHPGNLGPVKGGTCCSGRNAGGAGATSRLPNRSSPADSRLGLSTITSAIAATTAWWSRSGTARKPSYLAVRRGERLVPQRHSAECAGRLIFCLGWRLLLYSGVGVAAEKERPDFHRSNSGLRKRGHVRGTGARRDGAAESRRRPKLRGLSRVLNRYAGSVSSLYRALDTPVILDIAGPRVTALVTLSTRPPSLISGSRLWEVRTTL